MRLTNFQARPQALIWDSVAATRKAIASLKPGEIVLDLGAGAGRALIENDSDCAWICTANELRNDHLSLAVTDDVD